MRVSRVFVGAGLLASLAFAQTPQARTREELDLFGSAFEAADPLARIKACEHFLTRYPASEFREKVLKLEFDAFEQRGDRGAMERIGMRIVELNPANVDTLTELARAELPHDPSLAERHASQALLFLQTQPRPSEMNRAAWVDGRHNLKASAHATLGIIALRRSQYAKAITHLEESVNFGPKNAEWQQDLGLALFQSSRLERAADIFRLAHELKPDLPGPILFLGITDFRLGRFHEAGGYLNQAIALEPGQREAWIHLLRAKQALGEFDEALASRAALAFPEDAEIRFAIAQAALDRIREIARHVEELGPESPEYRYLAARKRDAFVKEPTPEAGAAYDRLGTLVNDCFEVVLRHSPGSSYAHIARGYVAESRNDVETALEEYRAGGDRFAAGRLLAQNVRLPEAEREFRAELEKNPSNHLAMADLAAVYTQQNDVAEAAPLLRQLLKLYPQDACAWLDLGKVQQTNGEWSAAVASFEKALAIDSSLQQARYRLFLTYRKLGQEEKAASELETFKKGKGSSAQ